MKGNRPVKILAVAGEESGDMHGAALLHELRAQVPGLEACGIGGPRMEAEGMTLLHHYRHLSVVGITEVVRLLPRLHGVMNELDRHILMQKPDLVILIDYPGFNLRLAKRAKRHGARVFYYIAPQVWAWGAGRIRTIAESVDAMAVILPFEPAVFEGTGMPVTFVGHPLIDMVKPRYSRTDFFARHSLNPERKTIGLLPGSRRQEIVNLLPVMLEAIRHMRRSLPDLQAIIGAAGTVDEREFRHCLPDCNPPLIVRNETYDVMAHSDFILTASGTATLETAILMRPMILLYKTSFITYQLARILVKIPLIGLVNIIADREVAPEFIQGKLDPAYIARKALEILNNPEAYGAIQSELARVKEMLGSPGAAARAAGIAAAMLKSQ